MKAITTRFVPATDHRGSRIAATDEDGNRVQIPYPHELASFDAHAAGAQALCRKMRWHGTLIAGSLGKGYVFVWAKGDVVAVPQEAK